MRRIWRETKCAEHNLMRRIWRQFFLYVLHQIITWSRIVGSRLILNPTNEPFSKPQFFRLFQTDSVCRRQFQIWWKWHNVLWTSGKHYGKRKNCSITSNFLLFPECFKRIVLQTCENQGLFGKRLNWKKKTFKQVVKIPKWCFIEKNIYESAIVDARSNCPIKVKYQMMLYRTYF